MLKLTVEQGERGIQKATAAVSWCIDSATREELLQRRIVNPYVLLITSPEGGGAYTERRFLAPLEQLMAYVSFSRPDRNLVYGVIVWCRDEHESSPKKTEKVLRDRFLMKSNGTYHFTFLNSEGEFARGWVWSPIHSEWIQEYASAAVVIPEGSFAKEPPAWERKWVEEFFNYANPASDPCEYGKRRFIAYSVQPVLLLLGVGLVSVYYAVAGLYTLFLLLCGYPLRKSAVEAWWQETTDFSILWKDLSFADSVFVLKTKRRVFFSTMVFAPIGWLAIFPVLGYFGGWNGVRFGAVLYGIIVAAVVVGEVLGKWAVHVTKRHVPQPALTQATFKPRYLEDELLVRDTAVPGYTFSTLPRERKTIRLRLQSLRGLVCKPFAR